MRNSIALALLLLTSGLTTSVTAEIRVLFSFDSNGHAVHKVVRDVADRTELKTGIEDRNPVSLTWYDAAGVILSTTSSPDPRVTRSPSHIHGNSDESRAILEAGAWLVTGPDGAESVEITLPRRDRLALGAEQWHLLLDTSP